MLQIYLGLSVFVPPSLSAGCSDNDLNTCAFAGKNVFSGNNNSWLRGTKSIAGSHFNAVIVPLI